MTAERTLAAGTTTLYTNTSGAGQAITVWGVSVSVSAEQTTAGTASVAHAHVAVGATTIHQVGIVIVGVGSGHLASSIDLGGSQFFLANGGTITLVDTTNSTNVTADCTITLDIDTGTP